MSAPAVGLGCVTVAGSDVAANRTMSFYSYDLAIAARLINHSALDVK